jgi:hypothetical protein
MNEQNKSIVDLWDWVNLKCTFRRRVDTRLFNMWEEIVSIASMINYTGEEDEMIWQFQSSGLYSSHTLYRVINFRWILLYLFPQCGSCPSLSGFSFFFGCCQKTSF